MPVENHTNTIIQVAEANQNNNQVVNTVTKPYPNDSVEISNTQNPKKKKKHKLKNFLIGLGTFCAMVIAIGVKARSREGKRIAQLYKDKLVISNLPEKIDFKDAETLEEAYKFTKEVLKIKEVDNDFTLDALNIINRGLVDVSNAHKGKVFMPRHLYSKTPVRDDINYLACACKDIYSDRFGSIAVNMEHFKHDVLNKTIDSYLYFKDGHKYFERDYNNKLKSYFLSGTSWAKPSENLEKYIEKYYKDPSKMSIKEKQELYYSMMINHSDADAVCRNPMETIQKLLREHRKLLDKEHFEIDFNKLSNETTDEQIDKLYEIRKLLEKHNIRKEYTFDIISPSQTIHHEMGHLQDYAQNLKTLHMRKWLSLKEIRKIFGKDENGKWIDRSKVDELTNRWGTTAYKQYKERFEKEPEKFKEIYPDWYEFLTNKETQITAGKVTSYAQSGIGEFIAETYAQMIRGKEIPEDVMRLYKKYNGPIPEGVGIKG